MTLGRDSINRRSHFIRYLAQYIHRLKHLLGDSNGVSASLREHLRQFSRSLLNDGLVDDADHRILHTFKFLFNTTTALERRQLL